MSPSWCLSLIGMEAPAQFYSVQKLMDLLWTFRTPSSLLECVS